MHLFLRYFLIVVLLCSAASKVIAQNWQWQDPLPHGHSYLSAHFLDASRGWLSGTFGTISRTMDGGSSWDFIPTGVNNSLTQIQFINNDTGWVCGTLGRSMRSIDGGNTWVNYSNGTNNSNMVGMEFTNNTIGFMNGNRSLNGSSTGFLYKSVDAGESWTELDTFPYRATALDFVNDLTGWVVGYEGMIQKTTDGGINWVAQNYNPDDTLTGVTFINPQVGWAVGYHGKILYTNNGGATWQTQQWQGQTPADSTRILNRVLFVNPTTGWIQGGGILLRYDANNNQWIPQVAAPGIMEFGDTNIGYAIGSGQSVFKSFDGGNSWLRLTGISTTYNGASFINTLTGWVCGSGGTVMKTVNGGANWYDQYTSTGATLYDIEFVSPNKGWIVGNLGAILTSDNGAFSWTGQPSQATTRTTYRSIDFVDSLTGWVVGYRDTTIAGVLSLPDEVIRYTNDGGATWQIQQSPTTAPLLSVSFVDANNGWACGYNGTIIRTGNGGTTWSATNTGTIDTLFSVYFTDNQYGWAIGHTAYNVNSLLNRQWVVLKTVNGGNTWTSSFVFNSINGTQIRGNKPFAIKFINRNVGWIAGQGGRVLYTTNGGTTWTQFNSEFSNTINAVVLNSDSDGWVVGASAILRYSCLATQPIINNDVSPNNLSYCCPQAGYTYQWYRNGLPIAGANSNVYVAPQNGVYVLEVSGLIGCSGFSNPINICNFAFEPEILQLGVNITTTQPFNTFQWSYYNSPLAGATLTYIEPQLNGEYTVEVTDFAGCTAVSDPFLFCLPFNPVVTQIGNSYTTGFYTSYQWLVDGNPVPGATTQTFTPANPGGVVTVQVTDAAGCSGNSAVGTFNLTSPNPIIRLYPNPMKDYLMVEWAKLPEQVELTDALGRAMSDYNRSDVGNTSRFDFSGLVEGVYYLKAYFPEGFVLQPVIVQ